MDTNFEKTVLDGVNSLQAKQATLLQNYDQLTADTKRAMEELTIVKNRVNDLAEVSNKLRKLELQLGRESRLAFGDPIARFVSSEERCHWLIGCFRKAIGAPLTPEQKTAVTGIDSGTGAAVTPQETEAAIYDALLTYGQWGTLGVIPVGSRTQILPLITARPTAYWVAQGAQITEGAFTGTSVTLTIKEAAAWIPVARALLDDASIDMAGYILQQLAEGVALRLDWACFAADGTNDTTDGAYTGIAVGGTAAEAAAGNTEVSKLDLEDFVHCFTHVDAGVLQRPCKWWMHPLILAKMCTVKDSNGRPIFQTALEAPNGGSIGSILGYPVVPTAAMPSTDAASQVLAVFGDPQAGAVGVRKQFELARSDEFQFDYNRTCFRTIIRAGFVIRSATSFAKLTTPAA
jgi:HK97 family phage major capsid protein